MTKTNFDFIIIGAGSAGCVLANRLTEDPSVSVLLIEAGGKDSSPEIHIPAAYSKLNYKKTDWLYFTEPQTHVDGRRIYQPRGKVLGGSSSTNAMAYVRGNAADYDEWAAMGATGWDHAKVLPFFKKSEHNEQLDNEFHSKNGLLNVSYAHFRTPLADAFLDACHEKGIPHNADYNGASQIGAGHFQFTIKNGKRHSTAQAFLKPVMTRPNLTVLTHANVKQILIEKNRATGVEILRGGSSEIFSAKKEVILSAGAFGSPHILMLSGIGSREELSKHGISVKKELEGVGKNLHDHLMFGISNLSTWRGTLNNVQRPLNQLRHLFTYLLRGKGPLTISPLESNAFIFSEKKKNAALSSTSDYSNFEIQKPDIQLMFAPAHMGNEQDKARGTDIYKPETYPKSDGFSILPVLLQPKSRGFVGLRTSNPLDAPIIQPNYLAEESDRATLVEAFKRSKEILLSAAFAPYTHSLYYPTHAESDDEILQHIKNSLECVYHPVSTCRMGNDDLSVVDAELRVHGIEGLRVIDGSVMPKLISGNTNAACIMIAEKGADLIKKTWKIGDFEG